jgi:hypothetical protein
MRPIRRSHTLAATMLALAVLVAGCGDDGDVDAGGSLVPDQQVTARIVDRDGDVLTLDLVELLSGEEAIEAARADGVEGIEDGLPNDYYLREGEAQAVTVRLADSVEIELVDCTDGCGLVPVTRADFVAGDVPAYGGPNPIVHVTITGGEILRLEEQYLP